MAPVVGVRDGVVRPSLIAAEYLLERLAEVVVEDRVQDGVHRRVGVAEPEEEGVDVVRDDDAARPRVHHVDDEETEPAAAEARDDDRHAYRRAHLALVEAAASRRAERLRLLLNPEEVHRLEQLCEPLPSTSAGDERRRRVARRRLDIVCAWYDLDL